MSEIQKTKVFVYNLPPNSSKENLLKLFGKCGRIESIIIKKNYAFIKYYSSKAASDSIRNFNNITYFGVKIYVTYSNSLRDEKNRINRNEKEKERDIYFFKNNKINESINNINNKYNINNNYNTNNIYKINNNSNNNYNINNNSNNNNQNHNPKRNFENRKKRFARCRKSPNRSFSTSLSDEDIYYYNPCDYR